ncbi:hypothetical protein [Streptomyces sp. GC420]|uniref:hypothetical protein n=1 Tax=Streptomyces sp. GC420 TaxID=2697568 RepID=UPI0014150A45|nr:hypothetical protein [Streptomyces sp. GC420]NBM17666.1 hypothetical protein [Streptomyces sp. GC420]
MVILSSLVGASGCSIGEHDDSVPELPEKVCWNSLSGAEVARLLPGGDELEIEENPPSFRLAGEWDSALCNLYIDGNTKLLANARVVVGDVDWESFEKPGGTSPLDAGDEGIIWKSGAAAYFACESLVTDEAGDGSDSEGLPVLIDLNITFNAVPEKVNNSREVISGVMREFVDFAREELRCDAG